MKAVAAPAAALVAQAFSPRVRSCLHFFTPMRWKPMPRCGFSLVEVVMALGIFSFAIVAIIALFGGVSKNTRALVDRDAMVAVWQSLSTGITGMSSTNIFAIPSGTGSPGRPEIFARAVQPGGATNAMSASR